MCGLTAFGGLPITPAQKQYLDREVIAIVHWGLNTFTNQEWGDGTANPLTTFPSDIGTKIDPSQWVSAMKAGGIKEVILVAKHHDGFCLWPATEESNNGYSTAVFPEGHSFKDYNLIQELRDACDAEGIDFGVYLSPWDRHHADWGHDDGKYKAYFHSQVKHIIDNYGPISEMWFDGALGDTGYYGGANESRSLPTDAKTYYEFDTIREYLNASNPNAVIFGGGCSNAVCWAGNELGNVPTAGGWVYDRGNFFGAPECDTPMGGSASEAKGKWFWHSGNVPKSLKQMVKNYFESVGRGGVLNWGVAPNQDGVIPAADVARLKEFGDYLKVYNASDIFSAADVSTVTDGNTVTKTLTLPTARTFNAVDFGENLDNGEIVTSWSVEANIDGNWTTLETGSRPGYRRIVRLDDEISATAVRITATGASVPTIERIHVRNAPVVADDGSVEIGGTDTEEWMETDEDGYHNVAFVGATPKFNFPADLTKYEVEIKLTGLTDKSQLSAQAGQYPKIFAIQGADGNTLSLSVDATGTSYGMFLTGSGLTGTATGTMVGTVGGNGDVSSTGNWTTADGTMTFVVRNDGTTLSVYKDGTLIVKTDKNFANKGKATSMTIGAGLATLGGGAVASIRYREAQKMPVADILNAAYLWLDASALSGEAGTEVASWASRNAGGKTASTTGTKPTIAAEQLDGKNVVDFGDPGSGKDLTFDRSSSIRTVFMVADVAQNANVFLLGDTGSAFNFHRGTDASYFSNNTDKFLSGTFRNGVKVEAPRSTLIPTGFGLITLVANSDATANSIGNDRNISGRNGGKKIAELIIFNKTLTDVERRQVEDYLMEKWLGYTYYTAEVEGDTNFSSLTWEPETPASFNDDKVVATIVGKRAGAVTFSAAETIANLRIDNGVNRLLTFKSPNNATISSLDLMSADEGLCLDATAGYTPNANWMTLMRTINSGRIILKGSGSNGATLSYGNPGTTFKGHLVFDGGVHEFFYQRNNSNDFAEGATADNPTLLVRNNTTLNLRGHDLSGWQGSANLNAIIEVEKGGRINCTQDGSSTFYYRQRLTINPGAVVSVNMDTADGYGIDTFRLQGGTAEATAQIYVPASEAGSEPAVIRAEGDKSGIRLHTDGTKGLAIKVEDNSTLVISNRFSSADENAPIVKYGAGTLRLTGNFGEYTSILTASAGTLALDEAATNTIKKLTMGAGAILRPAGSASVVTSFSATSFTLDASELVARYPDSNEIVALTIPEGSSFGTVSLMNGGEGRMLVAEGRTLKLVPAHDLKVSALAAGAAYTFPGDAVLNFDRAPDWADGTVAISLNGTLTIAGRVDVTPEMLNKFSFSGATSTVCAWTTREVISVNFGSTGMTGDSNDDSLAGFIYGSSWNNVVASSSGSTSLTSYWTGGATRTNLSGVTVTWSCRDKYAGGSAYSAPFQKNYLDENGSTDVEIGMTGIPYERYDVIIYYSTDSTGDPKFHTPYVNSQYYTCSKETGVTTTVDSRGTWGVGNSVTVPKFGSNAIRIGGLSGDLSINAYRNATQRGTVAAVQIINTTEFIDYTADVTESTAVWSTKSGLTSAGTWENGADNAITLFNETDGATVTLDENVTAHSLAVCSDDDKGLTLAKGAEATLSIATYDFTGADGLVTVEFSTGAASVFAGRNTVLTQLGTGAIVVGAGKKLTLTGEARGWTATSITVEDGGELVIGGGDTLTSVPFNTKVASVAGVVSYAATIDTGASDMAFEYALNRDFVDGADITAARFVNGNKNDNTVQVFNQRGGAITVTGAGDITAAEPTGVSPVLFAHWNSTVTYNLLGGSLTAVSGVNGSIYFARDGNARLSIGGGETTATLKTNGLVDDSRGTKDKTSTFIEILPNGVFEIGSFGIAMRDSREPFRLSGGTLKAYETASVSVAHANGVAVTANSVLAAETGETLTIASPLTGSGNLTIGTAEDAGAVVITNASTTATGTFTVTAGSTLVIPASTAMTSYTVSGAGTVKVVLSDEQLESIEPAVLGVKASDFTGSIVCIDGNGDVDAEHTGSVVNGRLKVSSVHAFLVWNGTGWEKQDDGTSATPDSDSILVLRAGDEITLSADLAPFAVHMPQSGTVAITGYRYLDVSTLQIPEGAVLRLVVDHNAAIGDDVVKSTLAFTGAGNVELWCSHSAPWVNGMPVVDANFADGFTGRLVIARGQYGASTALKSSLDIGVVDGGNLQLKGGTWNNHFYLSGNGWYTGDATNREHDKISLRLSPGNVGNNATLEFITDENGKKGSIGIHPDNAVPSVGCALVGTDGFRMGSGTIKLTAPTTQTAGLTGTVVVSGGTLVFGVGQYSVDSYALGSEVRVDSGAQLTWHTRTNTDTSYSETDKGKIGTAITLNGGTLHLEDGSYVFTEDFTVAANSTLSTKWGKGRIIKSLKGAAGVTLTITSDNSSDSGNSQNYIEGGDFAGTINVSSATGSGDFMLIPIGTALQNATVNLAGTRAYLKLIDDATIGALTGAQAVFGDGSPRKLTLKGGTYSGQLKDQADGTPDSKNALSLVIDGDVTLADVGTYSGNATINSGSLTVPSQYSDGKVVSGDADYGIRIRDNGASYTYYMALKMKPGASSAEYDTEPTDEDLAEFVPAAYNNDAAAAGQAAVLKVVKVERGGKWYVEVEIDADRMTVPVDDSLAVFAQAGLAQIASSEDATEICIPADRVTPGLYYSVLTATDVGFTEGIHESDRVLADGANPVILTVPSSTAVKRFFRLSASATPTVY